MEVGREEKRKSVVAATVFDDRLVRHTRAAAPNKRGIVHCVATEHFGASSQLPMSQPQPMLTYLTTNIDHRTYSLVRVDFDGNA